MPPRKFDFNSALSSLYRYNGLLVAEYEDDAGTIEVVEQNGIRRLHFGSGALQSCMSLSDPGHLCANYERTLMALLLFNSAPARTLMIGLGGGSLVRFLLQHNEHGHLHVVELRPQVGEVARNHFLLPDADARLQLTFGCGARHVAQQSARQAGSYQVIVVDAYQAAGMAPAVTSEEFFRHCHRLLSDQGLLVINLWRSEKTLLATITRHLTSVFNGRVHFIGVRDSDNMIGFAFAAGYPPRALHQLEAEARSLQQRLRLDFADYLQDLKLSDPHGSLFLDE
ncbi:MAG: fused MFS/spermidine synthase [Gammaproteobacteria bacterium]